MYAKIIIDQDAKALDKIFEYIVPDGLNVDVGMRVYVPFGKRILQGFIVELSESCEYDESKLVENTIEIPVQVNGKVRATIEIDVNASEDDVKNKVHSNANIQNQLDGKSIVKEIYVKNKIYNIVVK